MPQTARTQPRNIAFSLGADIDGTHGQGQLGCTYAELVATFGPPNGEGDGYKVDAEWRLTFHVGGKKHVASIYNYKSGKNYQGEVGAEVKDITVWHVGGFTTDVVHYIQEAMTAKKIRVLGQKGDWKITNPLGNPTSSLFVEDAGGSVICELPSYALDREKYAKLIQALPKLVEACQEACELPRTAGNLHIIAAAQAALMLVEEGLQS